MRDRLGRPLAYRFGIDAIGDDDGLADRAFA